MPVLARPYDCKALLGLACLRFRQDLCGQTDALRLYFQLNAYLSPYPDGRVTPTCCIRAAVPLGGQSSTILPLARRNSARSDTVASLPAFVNVEGRPRHNVIPFSDQMLDAIVHLEIRISRFLCAIRFRSSRTNSYRSLDV